MHRIAALNDSSSDEECPSTPSLQKTTKEAQEAAAFTLYNKALSLQRHGDHEGAEAALRKVLEAPLVKEAVLPEHEEEGLKQPGLLLKYSAYKNMGSMFASRGEYKEAMEAYLEAVMVDSTDVTLWYKIGTTALKLDHIPLARHGFEEALKCNRNHWPSLDHICTILYALNDYANCLYYISEALKKDCGYVKGLALRNKMYSEQPSLETDFGDLFKTCDPSIHTIELDTQESLEYVSEALEMRRKKQELGKEPPLPVLKFTKPLKSFTWKCLGECLVALYDHIKNADPPMSYGCKIDMSPYVNLNPNAVISETTPQPMDTADDSVLARPLDAPGSVAAVVTPKATITSTIEPTPVPMEIDDSSQHSGNPSKRGRKRKFPMINDDDSTWKRRSARVRNTNKKKQEETVNFQELLLKFLPSSLLHPVDHEEALSPVPSKSQEMVDEGKKTDMDRHRHPSVYEPLSSTEHTDVHKLLKERQQNSGILQLLTLYLSELAKRNAMKWPAELADIYIQAYVRLHKHIAMPYYLGDGDMHPDLVVLAEVCLVWAELQLDKWLSSKPKTSSGGSPRKSPALAAASHLGPEFPGEYFPGDLDFLESVAVFKEVMKDKWLQFATRAFWLQARYHMLENEMDMAVFCFDKTSEYLSASQEQSSTPVVIKLANCVIDNTITIDQVSKQLESLHRCQSLEEVQKLYEKENYQKVVDLLLQTFTQPQPRDRIVEVSPMLAERHAQLLLLQDALLKLKDYKNGLIWGEESFNEALQYYLNSKNNTSKEEWVTTMTQLFSGIDRCLSSDKNIVKHLSPSKLSRFTQNLIRVIELAMDVPETICEMHIGTVIPWILLYRLIKHEEEKLKSLRMQSDPDQSDEFEECLPSSFMLLNVAHEYLGRRAWCTNSDGALLLFFVEEISTILSDSDPDDPHPYKEDLDQALEQCFYCLYAHPNKRGKARHLQDHGASQIPLSWDRAVMVFDYFKPKTVPEFDSYRTSTVSAELEHLLKRIFMLIPHENKTGITVESLTCYIEGINNQVPALPEGVTVNLPVVQEICYLLADYYFKNKETMKANKFYMLDLTVNPDRFDSWAGMALNRMSKVESKLNSCELKTEGSIQKQAIGALRCFKRACELDSSNVKVWVEYGSLAYQLHSHAARQYKMQDVFPLSPEAYQTAKSNSMEMLKIAENCFTKASQCDVDESEEELWLHHYMLGKVAEKMKRPPQEYVEHYKKAAVYLHEDRARYPKKINYITSPPHLAVEALEVFYRLHAGILKYFQQNVENLAYEVFLQYVKEASETPFAKAEEKKAERKESGRDSLASMSQDENSNSNMVAPSQQPARRIKPTYHVTPMDHDYSKQRSQDSGESSDDMARGMTRGTIKDSSGTDLLSEKEETDISEVEDNKSDGRYTDVTDTDAKIVTDTESEVGHAKDEQPVEPLQPNTPKAENMESGLIHISSKASLGVSESDSILQDTDKILVPDSGLMEVTGTVIVDGTKIEPEVSAMETVESDFKNDHIEVEEHKKETSESHKEDIIDVKDIDTGDESITEGKQVGDKVDDTPSVDTEFDKNKEDNKKQEGDKQDDIDTDLQNLQDLDRQLLELSGSTVQSSSFDNTFGDFETSSQKDSDLNSDGDKELKSVVVDSKISQMDSKSKMDKTSEKLDTAPTLSNSDSQQLVKNEMVEPMDTDCEKAKDLESKSIDDSQKLKKESNDMHMDTEKQDDDSIKSTQCTNDMVLDVLQGVVDRVVKNIEDSKEVKKNDQEMAKKDEPVKEVDRLAEAIAAGHEILEVLDEMSGRIVKKAVINGELVDLEPQKSECVSMDIDDTEKENKDNVKQSKERKEVDTEKCDDEKDNKKAISKTAEFSDQGLKPDGDTEIAVVSKRTTESKKPPLPLPTDPRHKEVMQGCIKAMELCLSRFPQHYKALYRLACLYFTSPLFKNVNGAKDLLLGNNTTKWELLPHMPSPGLFQERKQTNLFNGIWRIPSPDIDRSGTFASHMYRSIQLLLDILKETNDGDMLFHMCRQLHKKPDSQKKYLRDNEREHLAKVAYEYSIDVFSILVEKMKEEENSDVRTKFLLDIHRMWQYGISKQQGWMEKCKTLLVKTYRHCVRDKINDDIPEFDQAIRYCGQLLQRTPQTPTSSSQNSLMSPVGNKSFDFSLPTTPKTDANRLNPFASKSTTDLPMDLTKSPGNSSTLQSSKSQDVSMPVTKSKSLTSAFQLASDNPEPLDLSANSQTPPKVLSSVSPKTASTSSTSASSKSPSTSIDTKKVTISARGHAVVASIIEKVLAEKQLAKQSSNIQAHSMTGLKKATQGPSPISNPALKQPSTVTSVGKAGTSFQSMPSYIAKTLVGHADKGMERPTSQVKSSSNVASSSSVKSISNVVHKTGEPEVMIISSKSTGGVSRANPSKLFPNLMKLESQASSKQKAIGTGEASSNIKPRPVDQRHGINVSSSNQKPSVSGSTMNVKPRPIVQGHGVNLPPKQTPSVSGASMHVKSNFAPQQGHGINLPSKQNPSVSGASMPSKQNPSVVGATKPFKQSPSVSGASMPSKQNPSVSGATIHVKSMPVEPGRGTHLPSTGITGTSGNQLPQKMVEKKISQKPPSSPEIICLDSSEDE